MLKIFTIKIIRLLLKLLWIMPVNKKRVVFSSYGGRSYSCNPKYIFDFMNQKCLDVEYIWVLNKSVNLPDVKARVIKVNNNSFKHIYYSLTAGVYITNDGISSMIPFRSKQLVINTWHGGGIYKSSGLGGNSQANRADRYSIALMAQTVTWFVSSSEAFSRNMENFYMWPKNKILTIGMPRNDQFFDDTKDSKIEKEVRQKFGIGDEYGVALYTPTFRGSVRDREILTVELDTETLLEALKLRFGKPFKLMYRVHHAAVKPVISKEILDGSSYADSQHLLQTADVLISDYSSILWDFSLSLKPSFIFAPDLEKYRGQDRGLTSAIDNWPFSIAENNQELMANIANFDEQGYNTSVQQHHNYLGSYEKGTATVALFNKINKALYVN